MHDIKVKRIDNHEFKKIGDIWNGLLDANNSSLFQVFDWASNWWDAYSKDKKLLVLLFTENDSPVAIAPLVITKEAFNRLPARKVELMYKTNFIIPSKKEEVVKETMNYLKDIQNSWDIIDFSDMESDEALIGFFKKEAERLGFDVLIKEALPYPYVDINKSWDEYWSQRKSKFKKNLRRSYRLIEDLGDVDVSVNIYDHAHIDRLYEDYNRVVELSMRSWKAKCGTALGSSNQLKNFYRATVDTFSKNWKIEISFLEHKKIPIAGTLGIVYKNVWYVFLTFYDEKYAKFSPGGVLIHSVFKKMFSKGISRAELLKGFFPIKVPWYTGVHNKVHIMVFKKTFRSAILKLSETYVRPLISSSMKGSINAKDK